MTRTFPGPPPDHRMSPQWIISLRAISRAKVYVRNYENLNDLKASVTVAFQEVLREMFSSTTANFGKRLKKVIKVRGRHIEN